MCLPAPAHRLLAVPVTLNTLFAPGFLPLLFLLPGMLSYRYLSGLSLTTFRSLLSEVYSDHTTIASTPLHSRKEECPDHSKEKPDCLSSETRIGKLETTQEYFPAVLFLSWLTLQWVCMVGEAPDGEGICAFPSLSMQDTLKTSPLKETIFLFPWNISSLTLWVGGPAGVSQSWHWRGGPPLDS